MTTSVPKRQSHTWDNYEYGRSVSHSSVVSGGSSQHGAADISPFATALPHSFPRNAGEDLHRRRSSITVRLNSLRHAGGVNSIDNFARSYQRASLFPEIAPSRRGSIVVSNSPDSRMQGDERATPHKSLLRQQLEASQAQDTAVQDLEDSDSHERRPLIGHSPLGETVGDIFARSYSTSYGSLPSRFNESSRRHAAQLFNEQQTVITQSEGKETEPLLVRPVIREDGSQGQVVVGQSTLPQTIFNSVNVLIGVGLLSLPLALRYAGWVVGMISLLCAASVTAYTAKLLAICIDVDSSLVTYADVAYVSFGPKARVITGFLFSLELVAAGVALVVLFADSLNALIGGWSIVSWKLFCGVILIPLNFVPLRLLSITSILGILCALGIVCIVFIDGMLKPSYPGSLRQPAATYAFPETWRTLPLSFGLIMSPWGGHSVFPNIYRDMRHPTRYNQGLWYTYAVTYLLDLAMAIIGYLMFGDQARDEITNNILLVSGYPKVLSVMMVIFIAIIPITKVPLTCRPIVSTIEILIGLGPKSNSPDSAMHQVSRTTQTLASSIIRIFVIVLMILLSIFFPDFDSIMALMGSALCFTICVVLPCSFYLKIFGDQVSVKEKILNWVLIIVCGALAIVGTIWAVMPKSKLGIE